MSRRPAGAPIMDWRQRDDWLTALAEAGTTTQDLAGHFAPAIAREVARFAQDKEPLFLISPSLAGRSALAAAHLLRDSGLRPNIITAAEFLASDRVSAADRRDFSAALERWGARILSFDDDVPAALVVDALFPADGVHYRQAEPEWVDIWRCIMAAADTTIAIDNIAFAHQVGWTMTQVDHHPDYTMTIALGTLRDQHVTLPMMNHAGHLILAPTDPPVMAHWHVLGRPRIACPAPDAHKYTRGMVVVVAGEMPGAARLSARAAASSGAGYVVMAGREGDAGLDSIVHRRVESADDLTALLADDRIGAVVIGPGLGTGDDARAWLDAALASDRRLVLDADALTLIGRNGTREGRKPETWITPHHGEWVRLTGDSSDEHGKFAGTARWAEEGLGIVHKGADTIIGTPGWAGVLDFVPPAWLSTAGTGDVLAGVLGARLAGRAGDWRCGHDAVWLHARAAVLAGPAFAADHLIDWLPHALRECL